MELIFLRMPYIIESIEDLERVLRENPEWRERIRTLILTEELIKLPQRFDRFVEEEFRPAKEKIWQIEEKTTGTKQDVSELKQDMVDVKERLTNVEQDVAFLKREVGVMKVDLAKLRGDNFERKIREKAPAFLGRVIRRLRPLDTYALADLLDDAVERGLVSGEEKDFTLKLDYAGRGVLKGLDKDVYIALEATLSLYPEDVEKAFRRASILSRATSVETIPVVVYMNATEEALRKADEVGVLTVRTVAED